MHPLSHTLHVCTDLNHTVHVCEDLTVLTDLTGLGETMESSSSLQCREYLQNIRGLHAAWARVRCYTSETSSDALNRVTCILINHMVRWDPWKSNCQRNTAFWHSITTPLAAVYGTTAAYDRGQRSEHSGVAHKGNPHQTGKTYTSALWQPDQLPCFISAHSAAAFCFPACSYYS